MVRFSFFQRLLRRKKLPDVVAGTDFIFFGLGNRGDRYAGTRHNIGFMVADALAERLRGKTTGRVAEAEYYRGLLFEEKRVLIVKPLTYMNSSGSAVATYLTAASCPCSAMLAIVDDFNLPFGRLRLRKNGSDGGHNGLKSIVGRIGEDFPRLRFGIGPVPEGTSSVDFVLGRFTEQEESALKNAMTRAVEACVTFARKGIEAAMNTVNN